MGMSVGVAKTFVHVDPRQTTRPFYGAVNEAPSKKQDRPRTAQICPIFILYNHHKLSDIYNRK